MRVLLVEPESTEPKLAVDSFSSAGLTVHTVDEVRAAVTALEAERFDLLLLDVPLAEADVFEATSAIRAREEITGEHVAILALTANAMPDHRARCIAAGMDGCLSKPIHAAQLFAAMHELAIFEMRGLAPYFEDRGESQ